MNKYQSWEQIAIYSGMNLQRMQYVLIQDLQEER